MDRTDRQQPAAAVQLEQLGDELRRLEARRVELVCELRNMHGWSWSQVAGALGVTKQAAAQRYGAAADAALGRTIRAGAARLGELRAKAAPTPAPSHPVAAPAVDVPLPLEQLEDDDVSDDPRPLYVVPCGATKLEHAAPARELYTGEHFARTLRLVTAAAQRDGADVAILSALHGLVDPGQVLDPYDAKLTTDRQARHLSAIVTAQLEQRWTRGAAETVRAWVPTVYATALAHACARVGVDLVNELEGCRGIGEQRARIGRLA